MKRTDWSPQPKEQIGRRPSTTKHIRTFYCRFCHEVVRKPNILPLRRRGCVYLCPRCGGHVYGNTPEVDRVCFHG